MSFIHMSYVIWSNESSLVVDFLLKLMIIINNNKEQIKDAKNDIMLKQNVTTRQSHL